MINWSSWHTSFSGSTEVEIRISCTKFVIMSARFNRNSYERVKFSNFICKSPNKANECKLEIKTKHNVLIHHKCN